LALIRLVERTSCFMYVNSVQGNDITPVAACQ
jgi:hypothetical protein